MTPTLAVDSLTSRLAPRHHRRTRAWSAAALFKGGRPPSSERLPSARCSISRSREASARSLDVHEPQPRTLSPDTDVPFLSPKDRRVVLPALWHGTTSRPRLASEREDASHRLLQPTEDTSTHGPFDSRADASRRPDRATRLSVSSGVDLPFGASTPGGGSLTAGLQLRLSRARCSRRSSGPCRSRATAPRRYRPRA
jgi:hypothetical protein